MQLRTATAVGGGLAASTVALLRRMRAEFEATGTLSGTTVTVMYVTYAGHAALTALAARRRAAPLPLPAVPATVAGTTVATAGAALCVTGMARFAGPRQVSGTEVAELATGGVYRYSRNPQYLGYLLLLTGVGLAHRSAAVLGLAGAAALAFRWWIPVEERQLDRGMGTPYRDYRRRTARWLGRRG